MSIITLTSDWGLKDHYSGIIKGCILSQIPDATITDISHNIPPFDIEQASFIIKNSYKYFPKNTIHIIAINTTASIKAPHLAILYDGHYFIGADNGIFSLIFKDAPEKIIELEIFQKSDYFTFAERDIFVEAACHLAKGKPIEELGKIKDKINKKLLFEPVVDNNSIKGMVIYIDAYENAITNITETLFKKIGKGRQFKILFGIETINKIHKSYSDVPKIEKTAVFNSSGLLEIAINMANASSLLGLKYKDVVKIEFEN